MISSPTIPRKPSGGPAFDQQELYELGLQYAQSLAGRVWTDYNLHDPGVTTLELLCYALTDLSYRASFPIEDLLATETGNSANMKAQFFSARQILPNRALTVLDYRKLLIDLKGVKNAWVRPAEVRYYADTLKKKLLHDDPGTPGIREVQLRGVYDVLIDYMDDVEAQSAKDAVMATVRDTIQANRNLCEDFAGFAGVETQSFILCAEIELEPDADVSKTKAKILFEVQDYLAPAVPNYTLAEMLEKKKPNGERYTADEIFEGPALSCGFIDSYELVEADLKEEIRLSDVISIIMDIKGVRAVRDIVISPEPGPSEHAAPLENKWRIPVESGKKALLKRKRNDPTNKNESSSRLVFYKRSMPVVASDAETDARYKELADEAREKLETKREEDLDIPLGVFRNPSTYYSFQNHFPAVYALSASALGSSVSEKRSILALQLKAYLLFFDQVLADFFAQLASVKELFSTDATKNQTYFYQAVNSFPDFEAIYKVAEADVATTIKDNVENQDVQINRRQRFLDHLISRFAEQFSDYVSIMYATFGATPESIIAVKCRFLQDYPLISSARALAYNYSSKATGDLWDTQNVSGLERRLARLLGIRDDSRRDLSSISLDNFEEGMYLIENILLRPDPAHPLDPFLPICVDPACTDCPDDDPYSYRVHVILPAYAGRFRNLDFRRFAEEVIRQETPAHILPKICWISKEDMASLQGLYQDWISLKAEVTTADREEKLVKFRDILYAVKNVYPKQSLFECDAKEDKPKFILGQSELGSSTEDE